MNKSNFTLKHVALYSKGWYAKRANGNTIFDDLRVMLSLDGYMGEVMRDWDVVSLITSHCMAIQKPVFQDTPIFLSGIHKNNVWKSGYEYKGMPFYDGNESKLPHWDMETATLYYCISQMGITKTKTLLGGSKLPMPDYKNGLPKGSSVTNEKLLTHFGGKKEVA